MKFSKSYEYLILAVLDIESQFRLSDSTIKNVNIEGNSLTTLQHEKASVSLIILTLHLPTACHEFISLVAMPCPSEEKNLARMKDRKTYYSP